MVTASIIIIGNEILSGRTADQNLNFLAKELDSLGISLREVRVIGDVAETIINSLNEYRAKYDYVFVTGGIGPTHDDITSLAVANAFGVPLKKNDELVSLLSQNTNYTLNQARLKMAHIPEGAKLIPGTIGFVMDNVVVMAGVPSTMQNMFTRIKDTLAKGPTIYTKNIEVFIPEGETAELYARLQEEYQMVEMGSYPSEIEGKWFTSLVLRSTDYDNLEAAYNKLSALIARHFMPDSICNL